MTATEILAGLEILRQRALAGTIDDAVLEAAIVELRCWEGNDTPENEVEERVIRKIATRRERGRRKYGVSMERTDLGEIDWLRHAQEEALDLAIYLERLIRDKTADGPPPPPPRMHV